MCNTYFKRHQRTFRGANEVPADTVVLQDMEVTGNATMNDEDRKANCIGVCLPYASGAKPTIVKDRPVKIVCDRVKLAYTGSIHTRGHETMVPQTILRNLS